MQTNFHRISLSPALGGEEEISDEHPRMMECGILRTKCIECGTRQKRWANNKGPYRIAILYAC